MARNRKAKEKKELIRSKVYYYGTTEGNRSWSRYKENDMFDRGFGELWLTRRTLYFRRYLTMEPFEIPVKSIVKLSSGHFHAGKFSIPKLLKVHWLKDDQELVMGFSMPKKLEELMRWQKKLQQVLK
jgi:hypothetical protein